MASPPEFDRRIIVYPDYINSAKTVAQGRRIPKDKACDWPTIDEMLAVCERALNLPAQPEAKLYPRNWCIEPGHERSFGRIRVQMRKEDGTPINAEVSTRRQLLLKLAEFCAKHPDRFARKAAGKGDSSGAGSSSGAAAAAGGKATAKKSGKKKK